MLILVKRIGKHVIIIYALSSVQEKFGVWIKTVPKSFHSRNSGSGWAWRTAEPFQIEIGVPLIIDSDELFMYFNNSMY